MRRAALYGVTGSFSGFFSVLVTEAVSVRVGSLHLYFSGTEDLVVFLGTSGWVEIRS